jgi:hypothetical protein
MTLIQDIERSREHEMKIYLSSMKAMYENALLQNGEIYDIAASLTDNFTVISSDAIMKDSRIIKIFRYAIAPSISQMKFGQFFGISSIDKFENDRITPGTEKYPTLGNIADKIATFISVNIDSDRFMWLNKSVAGLKLSQRYAKKWTCSIAADQNAQTKYRNWRKDQQEHAIASELVQIGYIKSGFSGVVHKQSDINIGEYTQELKVKGRTVQKADVIVRSKKTKKIILIEAKAVGVEIDSTKRIKECCDKANDWGTSKELKSPLVVAVIAGFFTEKGISNLSASSIEVIWEHRLSDLREFL